MSKDCVLSLPQVDLTFQRFRFLAPCQRLRAIVCVLSAYLRDDESSTCVCLRLREQCLRSEITSVSRVAHVLLLRLVAGNIGLYRDVWIAAIAWSRTSLETHLVVTCTTSQCKLRPLRANSGMGNVICIVTWYTLPPNGSLASLSVAMAFSR